MDCRTCRESLSARLDGEDEGTDRAVVDRHLSTCAECRHFAAAAAAVHRSVRLQPAAVVPDLTHAILGRTRPEPQPARREWPRYVLLTVALTQLVLALPALVLGHDPGASVHIARELGAWDVAFSFALLLAAWEPRRAPGILPFAMALTAMTMLAVVVNVVSGRAGAGEAQHATDLAGLVALWFLARPLGPVRVRNPWRWTARPA